MSAKLRFDDARHAPPLFADACVGLWAKVVLRCELSPERRGRSRSVGDRVRVAGRSLGHERTRRTSPRGATACPPGTAPMDGPFSPLLAWIGAFAVYQGGRLLGFQ